MTEKLKKPLFDFPFLLASSFVLLLAIFVVSIACQTSFLIFFILILLVSIFYLVISHDRLAKKQAAIKLQIQDIRERVNISEIEIEKEKITIESVKNKIVNYAQLRILTEKLSTSLDLEETSHTLVSEINKLFDEDEMTVILYLFNSPKGELGISSSHKGKMQINLKSKKGDFFDLWVVKSMQPLLIEDTKIDYRFDFDQFRLEDSRSVRSLISVPLMVGHKALGILRVDSPKGNHFGVKDLRLLTTIGDLGAVAIENAQLFERVEQLAIRDSLTGLYLRRYFLDRVGEEISRNIRHKNHLSFLMIDLDYFKKYNDQFGHMAGDIVLKKLGEILTGFFKDPGCLVCRYGGEEFSVLLADCSKIRAVELAQAVRKKVEESTILLRREKTKITVSIGVATFPRDAQFREELIHKADQALYQAKVQGRNRVSAA